MLLLVYKDFVQLNLFCCVVDGAFYQSEWNKVRIFEIVLEDCAQSVMVLVYRMNMTDFLLAVS